MRFTRTNIAGVRLAPGKSELIVFDEATPGFGLRVRAGGKRTWIAQYRIGTKQRRVSIGSAAKVDLDEARRLARAALGKVSLGSDPQAERAAARAQASVTLGKVAASYLTTYAARRLKPRSLLEVERHLRKHWAALEGNSLASIKRATVAARLSEIARDNGPFAANRARAALSALFSWAIGEGLADSNPVSGTHRATDEVSRDRVLTDAELALVWHQAGAGDFGQILRLLILTAARREEIGGARWTELQGETLRIGAERAKNRLPHEIPLSSPAMAIMGALPRRDERDLIFGSGKGPYSGWSRSKAELDARMLAALKAEHGNKTTLVPWRLHDLRRTAATRMADLGALPHVIEAVLGHISGSKAGVAGVYNHSSYAPEKRAALEKWGSFVTGLQEDCHGSRA